MDTDRIERVREFNRYYTRHLGVLTDRYLGQDRPLGQARLLFEIGAGSDVRELRERLGLDSGYLSRLLRALTDQKLITVRAHPADRRVRIAELTAAGHAERAELDRRSAAGIAELLDRLTDGQRDQLLDAQARIRRLLRTAALTVEPVPAGDPAARDCLHRYAAELATRFPEGYDPATITAADQVDGTTLLAREDGRPAGCGLWIHLAPRIAEIRHLWVAPPARGLGLGRRLLHALEADAAAHGVSIVRLGTHAALTEAIELYRRGGYRQIAGYSDSVYNQLAFEKTLGQSSQSS
ncbi:bifunctional helix-turn-helix transcriptional regulator/GNAT family N-acetyltransferase [Actinoplanes aureus]|jgi:DNA-binding MarR family transcriptional regulator/GNAT superfamily N-acetyltransferase|uniref:MarR family transcriptional regulator n=1 Tax=Actinoplanes aureus TaxID=2792083 RepID=A0A931C9M9_9ACTN|nr:bifunctional helix-turn-helix transcriptional regulator/GNAT family N-acetyltransferase [Actinoplanes aureus]MBG0565955.1 MarR family transcriptional regulator [Actinoplanes aureus]